jgi:hypothetical protein
MIIYRQQDCNTVIAIDRRGEAAHKKIDFRYLPSLFFWG